MKPWSRRVDNALAFFAGVEQGASFRVAELLASERNAHRQYATFHARRAKYAASTLGEASGCWQTTCAACENQTCRDNAIMAEVERDACLQNARVELANLETMRMDALGAASCIREWREDTRAYNQWLRDPNRRDSMRPDRLPWKTVVESSRAWGETAVRKAEVAAGGTGPYINQPGLVEPA